MSAPNSSVELIDWLDGNQLLQPEQIAELRPLLHAMPDARLFAKELIRRDWLTPYQVNQILQGKGDQLVLGCLRLRERLGEGAMGQVFKAWNAKLQCVVAVKTLNKDLVANNRALDRFRQEIEAAAQLDHPNIVKVRDADEIDSRPFMVMDYVDGVNLSLLVKTRGPLPIPAAVECIRQTAVGLQHAYERGVVHRDIKPANLLLERDSRNASDQDRKDTLAIGALVPSSVRVKILDFGLARFDSERRYSTRLTQPGSTLGTVDFMAPEQAESARDADTRADVYGLGCTLFYLLVGRAPFGGAGLAEKIAARLNGPLPSVRDARPEVPEALDRVVQRMMARLPADRYQTPAEVAEALQPFATAAPAAPALVPNMPRMELDERPAQLASVAVAAPVAPHSAVAPADIPLAQPIGVDSAVPLPPGSDGFFPGNDANPFSLSHGSPSTEALPMASQPDAPTPRPGTSGRIDKRLIIGMGAGAATLLFLLLGCGCLISSLVGERTPKVNSYPPGAALQITRAELSNFSDALPMGSRKNVIVKIRRVGFDGPVSVRLENLPPGVTTEARAVAASLTALEVPITASFGIDPAQTEIRVIATAKNLTAEKAMPLRVVPEKKFLRGP